MVMASRDVVPPNAYWITTANVPPMPFSRHRGNSCFGRFPAALCSAFYGAPFPPRDESPARWVYQEGHFFRHSDPFTVKYCQSGLVDLINTLPSRKPYSETPFPKLCLYAARVALPT
jgi:hypothetical protein